MPLTFGSGLSQIASPIAFGAASGGASKAIEDSAIAIGLLITASLRGSAMPAGLFREYNSEFLPFVVSRLRVIDGSPEVMAIAGAAILDRDGRKSMNPFAASLCAEAILRRLGIKTASSRILSSDEARMLSPNFIVKFEERERLHWRGLMPLHVFEPGRFALVCHVVPDSASVDFVRRVKLGIADFGRDETFNLLAGNLDAKFLFRRTFQALSKQCRHADALFADFQPTDEEWPKIKAAIDMYADAYLRIAASRVFVGCTAPHFANVLVTHAGDLVSIDHDSARFEDGTDLRMLFKFVRRGSRVFDLLGEVAALADDDIRAAVDLPQHPACGSTDGLAEYFCKRLALWRSLHAAGCAPARASATAV